MFGKETAPLRVNSAGQYIVDIIGHQTVQSGEISTFHEVMASTLAETDKVTESADSQDSVSEESAQPPFEKESTMEPSHSHVSDEPLKVWKQEDSGVVRTPWLSKAGPRWKNVRCRIVRKCETSQILHQERVVPGTPQHLTMCSFGNVLYDVVTEFHYVGPEVPPRVPPSVDGDTPWEISPHHVRQLSSQVKSCLAASLEDKSSTKGNCMVMEVFSPPRFAPQVQHLGLEAKSYDLKTGYDLSTKAHRGQVTWSASSLNSWFCALLVRMKVVGFI